MTRRALATLAIGLYLVTLALIFFGPEIGNGLWWLIDFTGIGAP